MEPYEALKALHENKAVVQTKDSDGLHVRGRPVRIAEPSGICEVKLVQGWRLAQPLEAWGINFLLPNTTWEIYEENIDPLEHTKQLAELAYPPPYSTTVELLPLAPREVPSPRPDIIPLYFAFPWVVTLTVKDLNGTELDCIKVTRPTRDEAIAAMNAKITRL